MIFLALIFSRFHHLKILIVSWFLSLKQDFISIPHFLFIISIRFQLIFFLLIKDLHSAIKYNQIPAIYFQDFYSTILTLIFFGLNFFLFAKIYFPFHSNYFLSDFAYLLEINTFTNY